MKKFFDWLKRPHGVALILFYVFTAAVIACSIVFAAVQIADYGWIAYIFYGLAAVCLGYTVYTLVIFAPKVKKSVTEKLKKHPFTNKLIEQFDYRTIIFAIGSLLISLANAVWHGVIGIVYLSAWSISLGAYYILLIVMRSGVLLYHRKKRNAPQEDEIELKLREINTYRICGILLTLLPIALGGIIVLTVRYKGGFAYPGIAIYIVAAYTFYKIVMSVINLVKARSSDQMTVKAVRNVNLADAMVSVLALQIAMFHEFSPELDFGLANMLTGVAVCALTAFLGVYMIINGSIKIKRVRNNNTEFNEEANDVEQEIQL